MRYRRHASGDSVCYAASLSGPPHVAELHNMTSPASHRSSRFVTYTVFLFGFRAGSRYLEGSDARHAALPSEAAGARGIVFIACHATGGSRSDPGGWNYRADSPQDVYVGSGMSRWR